jgi:pimeloyl-ACP methyl ester carboxylesterase
MYVAAMSTRLVKGVAVREWGDPAGPGILLWPGLGATGSYFAVVAGSLPGRAVAVDPPGSGASPPLTAPTLAELVELASAVMEECGCEAIIGHSLGAFVAAGVASAPPAGLRAAVLIDGGFLGAHEMEMLGMPVTQGRDDLTAWLEANATRFPDWDTAIAELAAMVDTEPTPALQAYVREVFAGIGGEVRDATPVAAMADLLLAVFADWSPPVAQQLKVPALLIACGRPAQSRVIRQPAWESFAAGSSLIDLHVAEDWNHNPILQAPGETADLISVWLRERL